MFLRTLAHRRAHTNQKNMRESQYVFSPVNCCVSPLFRCSFDSGLCRMAGSCSTFGRRASLQATLNQVVGAVYLERVLQASPTGMGWNALFRKKTWGMVASHQAVIEIYSLNTVHSSTICYILRVDVLPVFARCGPVRASGCWQHRRKCCCMLLLF